MAQRSALKLVARAVDPIVHHPVIAPYITRLNTAFQDAPSPGVVINTRIEQGQALLSNAKNSAAVTGLAMRLHTTMRDEALNVFEATHMWSAIGTLGTLSQRDEAVRVTAGLHAGILTRRIES